MKHYGSGDQWLDTGVGKAELSSGESWFTLNLVLNECL